MTDTHTGYGASFAKGPRCHLRRAGATQPAARSPGPGASLRWLGWLTSETCFGGLDIA
jgi:hypothetical protein